jgi:hypothetical protein
MPVDNDYAVQIRANPHVYVVADRTTDGVGRYANNCSGSSKQDGECKRNNARLAIDVRNERARLVASVPIQKGHEVFLSYGADYWGSAAKEKTAVKTPANCRATSKSKSKLKSRVTIKSSKSKTKTKKQVNNYAIMTRSKSTK